MSSYEIVNFRAKLIVNKHFRQEVDLRPPTVSNLAIVLHD